MLDKQGQIQVIFGPMFSGKTTELMRRIRRYMFANERCLLIKYSEDNRFSKQNLSTHDRLEALGAKVCKTLQEVEHLVPGYDVIGIDEGQFFSDIVSFSDWCATQCKKTVIVACLDGTFLRKPFGRVLELVPIAESITKLTAVCMICFKDASFSRRLGEEQEVKIIGGKDKYLAVCRQCYHKNTIDIPEITNLQKHFYQQMTLKDSFQSFESKEITKQ